jgi:hypothetical protein
VYVMAPEAISRGARAGTTRAQADARNVQALVGVVWVGSKRVDRRPLPGSCGRWWEWSKTKRQNERTNDGWRSGQTPTR